MTFPIIAETETLEVAESIINCQGWQHTSPALQNPSKIPLVTTFEENGLKLPPYFKDVHKRFNS